MQLLYVCERDCEEGSFISRVLLNGVAFRECCASGGVYFLIFRGLI